MLCGGNMSEKNKPCLVPKGLLRPYIIFILNEKPMHGYELIGCISKKTRFWKPSPGTVYPLLAEMVKNGILDKKKSDNKIIYSLTKEGRKIAKHVSRIRNEVRKRSVETITSILTEKELFSLHNKFIDKYYKGSKSYNTVKSAGKLFLLTSRFYAKSNYKVNETKKIIDEATAKLNKILKNHGE